MAITPQAGYIVDPTNPNGVIRDPGTSVNAFGIAAPQAATPIPSTPPPNQPTKPVTTMSSDTATNTYVPENQQKMQNAKNSGAFMDPTGAVRYNNGTYAQAPSYATQSVDANGNATWMADGKMYLSGPDSGVADPAQQKIDDMYKALQERFDANSLAGLDLIKQKYDQLIKKQGDINMRSEASLNQTLLMGGSDRYAQISSNGQSQAMMSYGLQQIGDLQMKEQSALQEANEAMLTGDMKFADQKLQEYQETQKTRQDAAKELNDKLQKAYEKTQAEEQQASKDQAIATAMGKGITDPAGILAELKAQGITASAKDVADAIANLNPDAKAVHEIMQQAAQNGASPELLKTIAGAKNVNDAFSAAGNYLQTATGDAGAYLFEKRQLDAAGKVAPDFATWQKALEDRQLASKLAELRATEGIKFNYSLALEKAKNAVTNAPNPNYHGEFAATVQLAAQAGSTNAQRAQIKGDLEDFISQGDYQSAYTQILSSASSKLTGANASNFQQQLQSYSSLKDMRDALKAYQDAGGDTNIFKGGADAIQTKIGALVTDPKYAALATRLNSAFQQYRQNMTGAAFGAKESSEYASVLPSSGNTFALNMAKIDGADQYLNSVVESTIKNTVGQGGIYVKQYAEAGSGAQQAQQSMQDKMTKFRSASPQNEQMVQELHEQFPDMSLQEISDKLGL